MKRFTAVLSSTLTIAALLVAAGPAAGAATGEVVVFSTEVVALDVHEDPDGCYALPEGAHVLANRTDRPVKVYGTPKCFGIPLLSVEANRGSHVPPAAASFRV
jgi:hypothetical protein